MLRDLFGGKPAVRTLDRGLHFANKTPRIPNLGDVLCSPRHYFDFQTDKSVLFVGGGAYNDLGKKAATSVACDVRIGWGLGQSGRFGRLGRSIDRKGLARLYDRVSTRDRQSSAATLSFVPCVSVLHPLVDTPVGSSVGLILNRDPAASGDDVVRLLDQYKTRMPDLVIGDNSASETEFIDFFRQTRTVVTNSYHAAYWSLLSGRGVCLVGYSTKFLSLLDLFGLPPERLTRYRRGDSNDLGRALAIAFEANPTTAIGAQKQEFRHLNLAFAASLQALGVVATPTARCVLP